MDLDTALTDKPAEGASATEILRADHREIARLFDEYEQAPAGDDSRRVIANTLCMQLELHDRIETDVFYPALASLEAGLVDTSLHDHDQMREAAEAVRQCADDGADCTVPIRRLKSIVEKHVAMEEEWLFPTVEQAGKGSAVKLGAALIKRKEELTRSTEYFEGPAT